MPMSEIHYVAHDCGVAKKARRGVRGAKHSAESHLKPDKFLLVVASMSIATAKLREMNRG